MLLCQSFMFPLWHGVYPSVVQQLKYAYHAIWVCAIASWRNRIHYTNVTNQNQNDTILYDDHLRAVAATTNEATSNTTSAEVLFVVAEVITLIVNSHWNGLKIDAFTHTLSGIYGRCGTTPRGSGHRRSWSTAAKTKRKRPNEQGPQDTCFHEHCHRGNVLCQRRCGALKRWTGDQRRGGWALHTLTTVGVPCPQHETPSNWQ